MCILSKIIHDRLPHFIHHFSLWDITKRKTGTSILVHDTTHIRPKMGPLMAVMTRLLDQNNCLTFSVDLF